MKLLVLAFAFSTSVGLFSARADEDPVTVFVDLNNSPDEISHLQSAVGKENIITIPNSSRTTEQVALLRRLADVDADMRRLDYIESSIPASALRDAKVKADATLRDHDVSKAKAIREDLAKSFGHFPFTEAEIQSQLEVAMDTHKVRRLVISGEHFQQDTSGEMGTLRDATLMEMAAKNASGFDAVKSLYFMRCDSGGVDGDSLWKSLMPNLVQTVFYTGRSPSGTNSAGLSVLENTVRKESVLLNSYEKSLDHRAFQQAARKAISATATSAAVCVCGECYDNKPIKRHCDTEGEDEVEDIMVSLLPVIADPNNDDNVIYCNLSSSPTRKQYDNLEGFQNCNLTAKTPLLRAQFDARVPDFTRLGALVFFQNVASNFYQSNQNELKALNKIASAHPEFGLPPLDLSKPMACKPNDDSRSPKLTRQALLKWISSLGQLSGGLTPLEKNCVVEMRARMNEQLTQLRCIPDRWVHDPDPNISSAIPSGCQTFFTPACNYP